MPRFTITDHPPGGLIVLMSPLGGSRGTSGEGPEAAAALPALKELLKDKRLGQAATEAIGRIEKR